MKMLTLYLNITTLLLLIWIYQFFYNCDSYKTFFNKNRLQIKNERVLAEGDVVGKEHTYAEGCLGDYSLDNKNNKWKNMVQYENPCDRWQRKTNPLLRKLFNKETSKMDPIWRYQKWNNEWNNISAKKVNDLSSIFHQHDISQEEKEKLIRSVEEELQNEFVKFLDECRKEMRDNKTESESKKEMMENRKEFESKKEMRDNKTGSESKNDMRYNKTESESVKEMIDNKTEFESMKEMINNRAETESMKEIRENRTESESEKEMRDNKAESESESESEKEMRDNRTESEYMKDMRDNKAESESESESESEKEMRDNETESEFRNEQGTYEKKNYKKKIWELHIVLIILR
ncbi:fam-g protein [Plasmodium gallinaceum]|uniref:Fam-g protein n=1 Tax=Plasmodium gallinaceum TaxID=5849 RepID=A0A1J1GU09_PLAGA|nr:fam-g protein [Plasmodium gallinaceum]CRG96014.1 fam-g protein [Plasmodium gallinaceum]